MDIDIDIGNVDLMSQGDSAMEDGDFFAGVTTKKQFSLSDQEIGTPSNEG